MSNTTELNLNEPMDFETLYKHKDQLVQMARETRMKYEVPFKVRDQEHLVEIVKSICETVSNCVNDWGMTDMIVTELKKDENKLGLSTSFMIFIDMPADFDPKAYGMYLSML